MAKDTEELLLSKMDQILRLLAAAVTRGLKQPEQIMLLTKAGFQPKDIATVLGTSSNTVRVRLVALRKKKGSKRRKKVAVAEE